MVKHFIEIGNPGFYNFDSQEREIEKRDPYYAIQAEDVKSAVMFRFYSRDEVISSGIVLQGRKKDYTGWYYHNGQMLISESLHEQACESQALRDVILKGWKCVVNTNGKYYPLSEDDKVLVDGQWMSM